MARANQTDWISRGVPLEKTVSAAMGYINSFLVPFAVDFTGLAQLLAKSARSHFRWRIICRGSENASTHHPIHLSGVSGKTIPYDANIVTGFVHSMPVVKQKRLWLGFQRPAKAAGVLRGKLVFDRPGKAYSVKHSKKIMPDQNLNFPRRVILGGALKLGGALFAVALLENNYN